MGAQYLIDDTCTACGACLLTCPSHAFVVAVPLTVDAMRCTDCGACVEVCPADAVLRLPDAAGQVPAEAVPAGPVPAEAVPAGPVPAEAVPA